jgi:hypothetical protein
MLADEELDRFERIASAQRECACFVRHLAERGWAYHARDRKYHNYDFPMHAIEVNSTEIVHWQFAIGQWTSQVVNPAHACNYLHKEIENES